MLVTKPLQSVWYENKYLWWRIHFPDNSILSSFTYQWGILSWSLQSTGNLWTGNISSHLVNYESHRILHLPGSCNWKIFEILDQRSLNSDNLYFWCDWKSSGNLYFEKARDEIYLLSKSTYPCNLWHTFSWHSSLRTLCG